MGFKTLRRQTRLCRRIRKRAVNTGAGQKILDLGCGTGTLTYELAKNGAQVTGVDSSDDMIKAASEKYGGITFQISDAVELPFENSFDTVFSNAVFHWIKQPELLLKNIYKVLKTDGMLVCEFGAKGNIAAVTGSFEKSLKAFGRSYDSPFYFPDKQEYAHLLEKTGFSVETIEVFERPTPLNDGGNGLKNFVKQFFAGALKNLEDKEREKLFEEMESDLKESLWKDGVWVAGLPENKSDSEKERESGMKLKFKKKYMFAFIIAAAVAAYAVISPMPSVYFFKYTFGRNLYTMPDNYETLKNNVTFIRNVDYGSAYADGFLDIILPQEEKRGNKLIFWIHGGGYIGGDKSIVEHYLVMLANEGYPAVNINYAVAPESHYPVQLKQIEEAFAFIKEHAGEYGIETGAVYFGGDSAGAQLAAQFVNMQLNPGYAKEVNAASGLSVGRVTENGSIAGAVLFCGPYNLKEFLRPEENTMILPFKKIGWAYFGSWDVKNKNIELTNIIKNLGENFPPVFITDGNFLSFENQAKELETALREKQIPVTSVFYSDAEERLKHEYQFYMQNEYAKQTYGKLLLFLGDTPLN